MDTELKVTDQPEEIAFLDMVAGDQIINIPLFQRAYKWTDRNLTQFWEDIDSIIDGSAKSHFLGVLVLVPQSRRVGSPALLDIVDGQQRLSTCYLTILAIIQAAAESGNADWAIDAARTFLLTRRFSNHSTNTKLIPSAPDRQQFHAIWSRLTNLPGLESEAWVGEPPSPPQPAGQTTGRMLTAYNRLLKKAREIVTKGGMGELEKVFDIVAGKLSFVTINLRTPTAAPAIFERLNARGERINISDLVRNEIFARVADDPMRAQSIFESSWEPLIDKFRKRNVDLEKLLFPYGLTIDPQITKADLFQALRSHWGEGNDPRSIIKSLDAYTPALFALEAGDVVDVTGERYRRKLLDLFELGAPSSIYSFVMHLTREVHAGKVTDEAAAEILSLIESFLFRRAVCGHEPTGLHAVFKGLWGDLEDDISVERVRSEISRRTTVPWPSDNEFANGILHEPLYGKRVAKYALRNFELGTDSESPSDDFEMEHIFPQTPGLEWADVRPDPNEQLSEDDLERIRNTWGNLIPLTPDMNGFVSNTAFAAKVPYYRKGVFSSARALGEAQSWDYDAIRKRSAEIAVWAKGRWPHGRTKAG